MAAAPASDHRMRTATATALAIVTSLGLASGCIRGTFGAGVARNDWSQGSRDPNPMRDPTEEQRANPWTETDHDDPTAAATALPDDDARVVQTIAVVAAALFGGWIPLLTWSGSFDESRALRR